MTAGTSVPAAARRRSRREPSVCTSASTCANAAEKPEIRRAYKALIKVLHPDMNGGDRSQEEQLSEVVWAWDQIRGSRNFRDE